MFNLRGNKLIEFKNLKKTFPVEIIINEDNSYYICGKMSYKNKYLKFFNLSDFPSEFNSYKINWYNH